MKKLNLIAVMITFIALFFLSDLIADQAEAGICPTPPCVDSDDIIDGQVTGTDLANTSVGTSKLKANAVTGAKVQDESLTGADIQDGSLTGGDISSGTSLNLGGLSVSGNVGIGTVGPGARLHVADPGTGAYTARFGTGAVSQFANVDVIANSGTNAFQVWDDNNLSIPMFIVTRGGNVGIGTTAPATKLHVEGDVTVTGNIAAKYQDIAEIF